jgi:predicted dehydrogenase
VAVQDGEQAVKVGIIGAGFMGRVHAAAARAARARITRVADNSAESDAAVEPLLHAERAAASAAELIADDEVEVVHICTPNYLHASFAEQAIRAGKHVICEKPLATSAEDARRLTALAAEAGVVAAVPFIYRYYPTVREVRARVSEGEAGELTMVHGSYLQDWLSSTEETNWRVDPALGGASRAFGDIGVHWVDIAEFTTGHRVTRLIARTVTAFPERAGKPEGVRTEDAAVIMFETDRGATGSVVLSQVAIGRKNRLWFSLDGTEAAYVFDQEQPDTLWVGGRRASQVIPRDPQALHPGAARYAVLPAGHPQGYQDCFNAFVTDCYSAIRAGQPDGLPTFADGLRSALLTEAVVASAATQAWMEVPCK